jgi:hypothetical protein
MLVFLIALVPTWMLHRAQRKPHGQ